MKQLEELYVGYVVFCDFGNVFIVMCIECEGFGVQDICQVIDLFDVQWMVIECEVWWYELVIDFELVVGFVCQLCDCVNCVVGV